MLHNSDVSPINLIELHFGVKLSGEIIMKYKKSNISMVLLLSLITACSETDQQAQSVVVSEPSPEYFTTEHGFTLRAPDLRGEELDRAMNTFCKLFDGRDDDDYGKENQKK